MKKSILATMIFATFSFGCNKVEFNSGPLEPQQKLDDPSVIDPTPTPTPTPIAQPLRKSGACSRDQSLLSCLKCEFPEVPPPPPSVSTKAQKLARIMAMSCQIYNKSYPSHYVAPTKEQIEKHLLACSPELYPETQMTASQTQTMARLLDESNDSLRQKMFKGLWYQPPYSNDFETYFGLDGSEAAYQFCLNSSSNLSAILVTGEYAKAASDSALYDQWLNNPAAQARWQSAQKQRQQLLSCFNKPATQNPKPVPSSPAAVKCEYRIFEGLYELGGEQEIAINLSEGFKIGAENSKSCFAIHSKKDLANYSGPIKIAGYKCR